jgi:nucleotide-binding universal stress UspA family protein
MQDRIIVATDGSDHGVRAVNFAATLSAKLGRGLSIVHVDLHERLSRELARLVESEYMLEHLSGLDSLRAVPSAANLWEFYDSTQGEIERFRVLEIISEQVLERARAAAKATGATDIRIVRGSGDYADEILDAAEAERAGIIVLGRRGLGRLREILLGSVTQKVLHATDRTVVVVQ